MLLSPATLSIIVPFLRVFAKVQGVQNLNKRLIDAESPADVLIWCENKDDKDTPDIIFVLHLKWFIGVIEIAVRQFLLLIVAHQTRLEMIKPGQHTGGMTPSLKVFPRGEPNVII